jgi:hypothetical protein
VLPSAAAKYIKTKRNTLSPQDLAILSTNMFTSIMAGAIPTWTSVQTILRNSNTDRSDLRFARRFCILVAASALITSQGDFTTTQRLVEGFSSVVGIGLDSRWRYTSIVAWKACELAFGYWLDCTGTTSSPIDRIMTTKTHKYQVLKLHLLHCYVMFP